jgi:hypothetical protein
MSTRKPRTADELRKLTDRQLYAGWRRMTENELRLVIAEVDRRAEATDFGRSPEWEGQADLPTLRRAGAR